MLVGYLNIRFLPFQKLTLFIQSLEGESIFIFDPLTLTVMFPQMKTRSQIHSVSARFGGHLKLRGPFRISLVQVFVCTLFILALGACSDRDKRQVEAETIIADLNHTYFFDSRVWKQDISVKIENNIALLSGETFYPQAVRGATKRLKTAGFDSVVSIITFLPEKMADGKDFGIVTVHHVMGRYQPVTDKQEATELIYGDLVRLIRDGKTHFQVQSPEGYLAYIPKTSLRKLDSLEWRRYHQGPFVKFHQNVSIDSTAQISMGARLPYLGNGQILLADGSAFKLDDACDYSIYSPANNPLRQKILRTGEKYLGLPYVWGGRSGKGTDCSGFAQSIFSLNGIYLPRDTDEMSIVGQLIGLPGWYDALEPGDLIFYTSGKRLITHVAIYYGNQQVIQAAGKTIHIASMDPLQPNYETRLVRDFAFAKRIID